MLNWFHNWILLIKNTASQFLAIKIFGFFILIITLFYFFYACERAESSKSYNLIGSESGRFFMILPANPGGIRVVGRSFIHKFVCCLWMSKTGDF